MSVCDDENFVYCCQNITEGPSCGIAGAGWCAALCVDERWATSAYQLADACICSP